MCVQADRQVRVLGHPKNYSFVFSKSMFVGSEYPKHFLNLEKRFTGTMTLTTYILCKRLHIPHVETLHVENALFAASHVSIGPCMNHFHISTWNISR